MVANIRSGSSPGGAPHYKKVDKGEVEVLLFQKMLKPYDRNGRLDVDVCLERFMPYLQANRRTTNTVFMRCSIPRRKFGVLFLIFRIINNSFSVLRVYLDGASCR